MSTGQNRTGLGAASAKQLFHLLYLLLKSRDLLLVAFGTLLQRLGKIRLLACARMHVSRGLIFPPRCLTAFIHACSHHKTLSHIGHEMPQSRIPPSNLYTSFSVSPDFISPSPPLPTHTDTSRSRHN
jgi:hypothetical protein